MGVSVKETSSETAMAKAEVNPKELMKRPTMPPMKPTGRKTASSDRVVAMTARPISLVPWIGRLEGRHVLLFDVAVDILQHDDGVVDHDADHQGQRQHGDLVEREAHGGHQREGGNDRRGNGDGGDQRGADVGEEEEDDDGGEEAALDEVALDVIDRGFDEDRLIADHLGLDVRRQVAEISASRCLTSSAVATVLTPLCLATMRVTAGTPSRRAAERGSS